MAAEPVTDANGNTITNTDSKVTDINANITGKENTITDSSNAEIVGDGNDVTNVMKGRTDTVRSDDARIVGSNNIISGSRNQQVIGDHNTIIGRDKGTVTDYSHPGGRDWSVSDITIGRENVIQSADTYRNEWDSLTVIGNHNLAEFGAESAGGPSSGIVIGDNQNIDSIGDSIVIGSLSPKEQAEKGNTYGHKYGVVGGSIIIGYHTSNSAGESVVIGNRSQSNGQYQTITGPRSIIEGNQERSMTGDLASVYGAFNKIKNGAGENEVDGIGNSITGAYNVTSDAQGTMIMGLNNTVTHAKAPDVMFNVDDELASSLGRNMSDIWLYVENFGNQYYNDGLNKDDKGNNLHLSYDDAREALSNYMTNSGGVVSVLGNNNSSDYTIRSQILGTNNNLTGNDTSFSSNNTISGFSNTGENLKSTSIIGTKNTLRNSEDNVVIGDYHNMDGGKHNVILGSMKSEEETVTKSYVLPIKPASDDPDMPKSLDPIKYTVTEQVPVKNHQKDIKNAVMVGYNTDVTQDGGVALGADSIASTEDGITGGITGFDALGKKHINSDEDYSTWVSTDAAVSVGGADREVTYDVLDKDGKPVIDKATGKKEQKTQIVKSTRQITNLAAGTQDTDAVNVAQLKSARTHFYSVNSEDATAGNYNNDGAKGENAIAAGVGASAKSNSSIAFGTDAKVEPYQVYYYFKPDQVGSIAIGKNAHVLDSYGSQELFFGFGAQNLPSGIAIGTNTYARSGSIDVGVRNMAGAQMAGVTIDKDGGPSTASIMDMTTVGTNSYNKGFMATILGAYSINTGNFISGAADSTYYGSQNMGSTIVGSLNQNRSLGQNGASGVANSIVGVANVAENANGTLIFGAGNNVKNSNSVISGFDMSTYVDSVDGMVDNLSNGIRKSNGGGATLVIGGGNTAENTLKTQIIGVNNTVKGKVTKKEVTSDDGKKEIKEEVTPADFNMINAFNTTVNGASHLYTIGSDNTITDTKNTVLIGDNHTTFSLLNSIIIGSNRNADDSGDAAYHQKNIINIGNNNTLLDTDGSISIGNNNYMWRSGGQPEKLGYDTGNVAIGNNTYINSYVNQGDSIVIGKNATVLNRHGTLEHAFSFGKTEGKDYPGSIAIGQNSYARSGSTMIGVHTYEGQIGDLKVSFKDGKNEGTSGIGKYQESMDVTTIGNDSYNNGVFSTVVGSYTAVSGAYHTAQWAQTVYGVQNFGAAVLGSLNSVESVSSKGEAAISAGMADSILGSANRTKNANGTIMVGAGNVVEDSSKTFDVSEIQPQKGKDGQPTPNALSAAMRESIKNANGGGAAAVVGNGNEVKNSTNVSVFGSKNSVTYTTNSQIYGDNRSVTGADGQVIDGAVIVGSADAKNPLTTNNKNVTILGYNANVIQDGGVAIGANSVASTAAFEGTDNVGYDPANGDHSKDTTGTWKSTAAAVSVGKAEEKDEEGKVPSKVITRQITNLAAGAQDTDAVNVAQLKAAITEVQAGTNVTVTKDTTATDGHAVYKIDAKDTTVSAGDHNFTITPNKDTTTNVTNYALSLANKVTIGSNEDAKSVTIDGTKGEITGLSNTTIGEDFGTKKRAATEEQLRTMHSTITGEDRYVNSGSIDTTHGKLNLGVANGTTVSISGLTDYQLDTDASQTKYDAKSHTLTLGMKDTLNTSNGKKSVSFVGIASTDDVAKATTEVTGDNDIHVTPSPAKDGHTIYTLGLANKVTIGNGEGAVTIDGTKGEITGLTNTTWDKNRDYSTSNKAATEAQIQQVMKDAQEAAEANDTDTHVKEGTYAVTTVKDAADKDTQGVALDVVDKTGTSVGKVTITDVAKASDVGDVSKLSKEIQNTKGSTTVVDAINNVDTKVNTVDNKVGDLNYSSTHYVKSGDNVTTSISNLDKAIHDATTEAEKHHSTVSEGNNIKVTPTTTNGKTDYKVSLSDDINVNSVTAKAVTTDNLTVNKSATIGKVTINADDKGTIGGLTNKTWDAKNITSGQAATEDQLQAATKNAVNYDGNSDSDNGKTITLREDTTIKNVADTPIEKGSKNAVNAGTVYKATKNAINYDGDDSKTITLREDTTINNVADTTIEQGSKNAVNAGTVYNETRVAKDGNFVKQANTAGENLSALDNQVTANTESIYHMNGRISDLDNRVNKVGAGAAALAALHPLDFDPDDKWDFAVGYGNYRNANSVAFGAFYRPNEDTMFSLGTNFGNGENMFNAGLSFKIGQGSGITTSKTAMAKKIESLEDTVDKQDKKIAELEALVKEQGEMIRQYVGKK